MRTATLIERMTHIANASRANCDQARAENAQRLQTTYKLDASCKTPLSSRQRLAFRTSERVT